MKADAQEQYRRRLVELQRELVSRVIDVENDLEKVDDADEVEIMDRVQADVVADSLEGLDDLERQQLEDVEGALDRIDAGSYGRCVDCGREIRRERLDAVPWTARCQEDQERLEREQREHFEAHRGKPRG